MTSVPVYIKCPPPAMWTTASLVSTDASTSTCVVSTSSGTQTIDLNDYPNQTLPLQNLTSNSQPLTLPNLITLPYLHEPGILFNLKSRHQESLPYTSCGDIILAVNPYKWLPSLYTPSIKSQIHFY